MTDKDDPFGSDPPSTDAFGRPISGSEDAFGSPAPMSQPPPGEGWQTAPPPPPPTGQYGAPPTPGRKADGAVAALILGIVGIVLCSILAPFAWAMGNKAQRLVDASGGTLGGRGEATAGKILGIIGTVFLIITIVALIAIIAFGTSVDTGGDTTTNFEF